MIKKKIHSEEKRSKQLLCFKCGQFSEDGTTCIRCLEGIQLVDDLVDAEKLRKELAIILDNFGSDVAAAFRKDPAASSVMEVLYYPGIQAILLHRIAHFFWKLNLPYIPRYLNFLSRQITGVDIHPGANVGKEFFIDHGTGVVVGETSKIGNNVTMYQGSTLGGTGIIRSGRRHPIIGNDVVIGAGAKVLGPINIGDKVKIGANSVITKNVPKESTVVGVPGTIIARKGRKIPKIDLAHGELPNPFLEKIQQLEGRIAELEKQLSKKK